MLNNPAIGGLSGMDPQLFFSNLITATMSLLIVIGAVIFLFMLLSGAIEWMTAGGDKGKLEEAKQRLSNAIIGIVVLFSFFAILNLVECFFGIGLRGINVGFFSISFVTGSFCR